MSFNTVIGVGKGEYKSRGSRFIAFTHGIENIDSYRELIYYYKNEFSESCHVCSAYRLFVNNRLDEQASDDGEPKGSSGLPILNQLKSNDLINSATFVARIFGGTLLGIPGLVDAYSNAALASIDNANQEEWIDRASLSIVFDYELKGAVASIILEFNAKVTSKSFKDDILFQLLIDRAQLDDFKNRIKEKTSARVKIV